MNSSELCEGGEGFVVDTRVGEGEVRSRVRGVERGEDASRCGAIEMDVWREGLGER